MTYWGAPSSGCKFYKGPACDTPWNHDLLWTLRVSKEAQEAAMMEENIVVPPKIEEISSSIWTEKEIMLLENGVRNLGVGNWNLILRDKRFKELSKNHNTDSGLKEKWRQLEGRRVRSQKHTGAQIFKKPSINTRSMKQTSSAPNLGASPIVAKRKHDAKARMQILEEDLLRETRARNLVRNDLDVEKRLREEYQKKLRREGMARKAAEKRALMYKKMVDDMMKPGVQNDLKDSIDEMEVQYSSRSPTRRSGTVVPTTRSQMLNGSPSARPFTVNSERPPHSSQLHKKAHRTASKESDEERQARLAAVRCRNTGPMKRLLRCAENGVAPPTPVIEGMGLNGYRSIG